MPSRSAPSQEKRGVFSPFVSLLKRNIIYRHLWLAYEISLFGDFFNYVATLVLINVATTSKLAVAAYLIIRRLPPLLLGPVVGVVADSFDRRRIMMLTDAVRAVVVCCLSIVGAWILHLANTEGATIPAPLLWALFILTFLVFSISAFFDPARSALIPQVVEKEDILTASILDTVTRYSNVSIGSALSGLFVSLFGVFVVYVLDAFTYVASFFLILAAGRHAGFPHRRRDKDGKGAVEEGAGDLRRPLLDEGVGEEEEDGDVEITSKSTLNRAQRIGSGRRRLGSAMADGDGDSVRVGSPYDAADFEESGYPERSSSSRSSTLSAPTASSTTDIGGGADRASAEAEAARAARAKEMDEIDDDKSGVEKFLVGLRFLNRNRYILALCFVKMSLAASGIANMTNIEYATGIFALGVDGSLSLGMTYGAIGIATAICPLILKRFTVPTVRGRQIAICYATFAAALGGLVLAWSPNFAVFLLGNMVRSSGVSAGWAFSTAILQEIVPNRFRGRVFSCDLAVFTVAYTSGVLFAGLSRDLHWYEPWQLMLLCGLVTSGFLFVWVFYFYVVRRSSPPPTLESAVMPED